MSQSKWRENYAHLVAIVQETIPQSDPGTRFRDIREEMTGDWEEMAGRGLSRQFILRQEEPPHDDGSTGIQRRRMRVGMALEVLYPRGLQGEFLSGEDGPLLEARLRLYAGCGVDCTIEHIPPSDVPELTDIGTDGRTGSVLLRILFDVIYMEDNTP